MNDKKEDVCVEQILDIIHLFSDMYDISLSESKRLLKSGGLYLNNVRLNSNRYITVEDFLYGKCCLLRKGKKDYKVLTIKI